MQRSTDRILTTHAGSLPRPADLLELIQAKATGRPYDHEAFTARVRRAVGEIVGKQAELHSLRQRAAVGLRARSPGPDQSVGGIARGARLPGVLRVVLAGDAEPS